MRSFGAYFPNRGRMIERWNKTLEEDINLDIQDSIPFNTMQKRKVGNENNQNMASRMA